LVVSRRVGTLFCQDHSMPTFTYLKLKVEPGESGFVSRHSALPAQTHAQLPIERAVKPVEIPHPDGAHGWEVMDTTIFPSVEPVRIESTVKMTAL
jgi:hypothetical protein